LHLCPLCPDSVEKLTFVLVSGVELNGLHGLVTLDLGPALPVCEGFGWLLPLGTHLLPRGPEASHALTFKPDQSMGADQDHQLYLSFFVFRPINVIVEMNKHFHFYNRRRVR